MTGSGSPRRCSAVFADGVPRPAKRDCGGAHGRTLHKGRHTAGQSLLDATGNLKAVQKLLRHKSIMTTADVYVDWDLDQLAQSLADALKESE